MVSEKTKMLGIIGDPVIHSLSPMMQNHVLSKLKLNLKYVPIHVTKENLSKKYQEITSSNFIGFNVTVPHKVAIMPYLDQVTKNAERLGAVNTVKFIGGRSVGYNTDFIGFMDSLRRIRFDMEKKKSVVLGAGGSSRAIIYALIESRANEITIINRTIEKADKLGEYFSSVTGFTNFNIYGFQNQKITEKIKEAAILVNTTSLGMDQKENSCPLPENIQLPGNLLVYDLIYKPLETKLLKIAKTNGARTLNGLDMLIYQGIESLRIWTGLNIESNAMYDEVKQFLLNRINSNE